MEKDTGSGYYVILEEISDIQERVDGITRRVKANDKIDSMLDSPHTQARIALAQIEAQVGIAEELSRLNENVEHLIKNRLFTPYRGGMNL